MSQAARHAQQMRVQAALAAGLSGKVRLGQVTSYDKDRYAAKVTVQPEGYETGFLPIATLVVGNGWGLQFGPAQGDQAVVVFQEGDPENGLIVGFLYSDQDRPQAVPAGEVWLSHEDGAHLKLTNDGKIKTKGTWEHDGDLKVTGDVEAEGDLKADDVTAAGTVKGAEVKAGLIDLGTHTHTGVVSGPALSGPPSPV